MIELTLPYPPTVNHYWGTSGKRRFILPEGINFRNQVFAISLEQDARNKLTGRLKIEIKATMPDNRIRDLDNLNKAILDALTHSSVIEDDKYIDDLHIVRSGIDKNHGRVEVTIKQLSE